jgi:hypothetical protein
MNVVADLALQPLFLVHIDRNRSVAALRNAAAATRIAIREVCTMLNDIERTSICPNYALTV